jgi:hypothetical protein
VIVKAEGLVTGYDVWYGRAMMQNLSENLPLVEASKLLACTLLGVALGKKHHIVIL